MFEADVPAEWCEQSSSSPPVSLPSWLKPPPGTPSEAPAPPSAIVTPPTMPPPAPLPVSAPPASLPRPWPVANEGGPPSVSTPSRRSVAVVGPDPAEIEKLHAALIEAIAVGVRARREALAASERDLVHLALAIAGKVVGRELASDPAVIAAWAREGIAALGEQDQIVVAISPDLAERLPLEQWTRALEGASVVIDRTLPTGGCEVRGSYGRVDAGLAPRLAAVAETLEEALPGGMGSEAA